MKATLLDLFSAHLSRPERSFDFALRLRFAPGVQLSLERLEAGAAEARRRYPRSAARLTGLEWRAITDCAKIRSERVANEEEARSLIQTWMTEPFHPSRDVPIRQLLIEHRAPESPTSRWELTTRFHHAAGDAVSLALWLQAQLGVAFAKTDFSPAPQLDPPVLKDHPAPARKSRYAFSKPCHPIRAARQSAPSVHRRWRTLELDPSPIRAGIAAASLSITYNDVLCAIILSTLRHWNRGGRLGLWLGVNIREQPFDGFGNGSSRIRVYDRAPQMTYSSLIAQAKSIREQIRWCKEQGEWHVPGPDSPLFGLPSWILIPFLKTFARRPGVDMASTLFSHAERLSPEPLPGVESLEAIGPLHDSHPFVLIGLGLGSKTFLTFTWDPALYGDSDAEELIRIFEKNYAEALGEIAHA